MAGHGGGGGRGGRGGWGGGYYGYSYPQYYILNTTPVANTCTPIYSNQPAVTAATNNVNSCQTLNVCTDTLPNLQAALATTIAAGTVVGNTCTANQPTIVGSRIIGGGNRVILR